MKNSVDDGQEGKGLIDKARIIGLCEGVIGVWEQFGKEINIEGAVDVLIEIREILTKSPALPVADGEGGVDWKAKYEKCINIIRRFDAGIIGMYDL